MPNKPRAYIVEVFGLESVETTSQRKALALAREMLARRPNDVVEVSEVDANGIYLLYTYQLTNGRAVRSFV